MKTYRYQAKDIKGNDRDGTVKAASKSEAEGMLVRQDLIVIELEESVEGETPKETRKRLLSVAQSQLGMVPPDELAQFFYEMSVLLQAAVPVPDALDLYLSGSAKTPLERELHDVVTEVRAGGSLSDALRRRDRIFPPICAALVKSGESSGTMPRVFRQLSTFFDESQKVRDRIVSAATYPMVVAALAGLVVLGLVLVVAPRFAQIYEQIGLPLPLATRIFLELGNHDVAVLAISLVALALMVGGVLWLRTSPQGPMAADRLKLRLWVVGPVLRQVALASFCHTLAMLQESGMRTPEAVDLAADAAGNRVVTEQVRKMRDGLLGGQPLSAVAAHEKVFSAHDIGMIRTGETSGQLSLMLTKLGDLLSARAEARITKLLSLVEPLLISFIAVGVGGTVLALAFPILNLPALLSQ